MDILAWLVVGVIAGLLAHRVGTDKASGGLMGSVVMGVIGSVVVGWIVRLTGLAGASGVGVGVLIAAFAGGVVLLWAARAMMADKVLN